MGGGDREVKKAPLMDIIAGIWNIGPDRRGLRGGPPGCGSTSVFGERVEQAERGAEQGGVEGAVGRSRLRGDAEDW
jgi:hypothetical protein